MAQETEEFKGNLAVFSADGEGVPADETGEVNVGGLVMVKIHDKGSASVEDVKVTADKSLKYLGSVWGVGYQDGQALMGGGYTLCLLKPVSEAKSATIKVTYKTAPHAGGKEETETYKVAISPPESEEQQ